SNLTGCSFADTILVSHDTLPKITAPSITVCEGATGTLIASGAVNYVWSNGVNNDSLTISPFQDSTFLVTGTDANNCFNTTSAQVFFQAATPNALSCDIVTIRQTMSALGYFEMTG